MDALKHFAYETILENLNENIFC